MTTTVHRIQQVSEKPFGALSRARKMCKNLDVSVDRIVFKMSVNRRSA